MAPAAAAVVSKVVRSRGRIGVVKRSRNRNPSSSNGTSFIKMIAKDQYVLTIKTEASVL